MSDVIDFTANLSFIDSTNVESYDVFINEDYYGSDVQEIQITTNDVLRIDVVKTDNTKESLIKFESRLV